MQSAEALVELSEGTVGGADTPEPELAIEPPAAAPEPEPAESAPQPRRQLPEEGVIVTSTTAPAGEDKPKKAGWWQRGFFGN
jgi:ribonuclease E